MDFPIEDVFWVCEVRTEDSYRVVEIFQNEYNTYEEALQHISNMPHYTNYIIKKVQQPAWE